MEDYGIVCDPANMLVVQMTETKTREHSQIRLARTFHYRPEVKSGSVLPEMTITFTTKCFVMVHY